MLVLALLLGLAPAQIAIKDQPGPKLLEACEKLEKEKTPRVADLLAMKPEPIPKDAAAIFLATDWVELGGYMYNDKAPSPFYGSNTLSFRIVRHGDDGGRLDFACQTVKNGGPKCTHTNFDDPPTVKEAVVVKNGVAYLAQTAYGETSYNRIVRMKDGVLIVDVTKSGKVGDKKTAFRNVYAALPKLFQWKHGE